MDDSKTGIWVCLSSYINVSEKEMETIEEIHVFVKDGCLICAIGAFARSPLRLRIFARTHWTGAPKELPIRRICGIFWKVFIGVSLGK